jgi:hypothetical protein
MLDEDAEHPFEMAAVEDQEPVETLRSDVRTKRSATAFPFGARTGVRTISIPSLRKTMSKSRVNLLSGSRIRKRTDVERSAKPQAS